ncbi:MAG: CRTAC1 family protein [Sphingomonadaceae bacterium]|nr:CRTAC1 family protein [Sphingomonadaceae bacterium]
MRGVAIGLLLPWSCAAVAATCPAPAFETGDFRLVDGTVDRGWPGGISLVDVDDDGDIDLLATQGYDTSLGRLEANGSRLYLNDGQGGFGRAPISGIDMVARPASGSSWADIDGDGDPDAFVPTQLRRADLYYRNIGDGRFIADDLGSATATKGSNFSSTWADLDSDGDMDLLVGGPALEAAEPMLVFRNDAGRFVEIKDHPLNNGANNGGSVVAADFDNDGDSDVLVANSDLSRRSNLPPAPVEHPVLYRNDAGWKFVATEGQGFASAARFPALSTAIGDVDNDGDLDLVVGMVGDSKGPLRDRLLLNDGRGGFVAASADFGEHRGMQAALALADLNGDGNLDLLAAAYDEPIGIYPGDGRGGFAGKVVIDRRHSHSSAAVADLDGDGRLDVVIGSWAETTGGQPITLLMNRTPRCGGWTEILLRDASGAINPPGSRVTLVTQGGARQLREASAQTGFRSLGASFFLFGVPTGDRLEKAIVRWPDGQVQVIANPPVNRRLTVRR